MPSIIETKRYDAIINQCTQHEHVALIIGGALAVVRFQQRTVRNVPVWMLRSTDMYHVSDHTREFPGIYVSVPMKDKGQYTNYGVRGVGLVAEGVSFDPQKHPISSRQAISHSPSGYWDLHETPFWEEAFLREVRTELAKYNTAEVHRGIAHLDRLLEQIYPRQPHYLSGTDPTFHIYTTRSLPVVSAITSYPAPKVSSTEEHIVHVAKCCATMQNSSHIQIVHDGFNVMLVDSGKQLEVEDLTYLPKTHWLPGMIWFQKRPVADPLAIDAEGFGLFFKDRASSESSSRQRLVGMMKRLVPSYGYRTHPDVSLVELLPCFGKLPDRLPRIQTALLDVQDLEGSQSIKRLIGGLDTAKDHLDRIAAGQKSRLLVPAKADVSWVGISD